MRNYIDKATMRCIASHRVQRRGVPVPHAHSEVPGNARVGSKVDRCNKLQCFVFSPCWRRTVSHPHYVVSIKFVVFLFSSCEEAVCVECVLRMHSRFAVRIRSWRCVGVVCSSCLARPCMRLRPSLMDRHEAGSPCSPIDSPCDHLV